MAAKRRKKGSTKGAPRPAAKQAKAEAPAAPGPERELIDMGEAIKLLKTTRPTFYRWLRAGKIKGMKLGRQWRFYREDVERFLTGQEPRVDLPADMGPLIRTLRERVEKLGVRDASWDDLNEVQQAVRLMIVLGVLSRASDIHITPHIKDRSTTCVAVLRNRIDGVLHPVAEIDMRLAPAIVEEWKRMAACDVHDKDRPQDGRIMMTLPECKEGQPLDMRVCFLPTGLGPSVTVRLLEPAAVLNLTRIDYAPHDLERIRRGLSHPWGIILATGPTGSGKTTTLYACLNELAKPEAKVMSVENPIECFLPWVTQVEVRDAAGLTFERAMRSVLRSDPDVILFGEIRSFEALCVNQQAALTGHLVLTTLHTDEAAGALRRMVDMGSDPFLIADSTKLIIAQRLIRRLCPHCSVEEKAPPADRLDAAAEAARRGGVNLHSIPHNFRKAVGCPKCGRTGYRGRTVAAETLEVTPEIGRALRNGAPVEELRAIAVGQGMTTMAADGARRAASGETSLDEVMRVST